MEHIWHECSNNYVLNTISKHTQYLDTISYRNVINSNVCKYRSCALHSGQFNYGCPVLLTVLFNDALNTFYVLLQGVGHMVKDQSAREETRCFHIGYSLRLAARFLLYMHHPTDRVSDTTAFVTPVAEPCLEREIAKWGN